MILSTGTVALTYRIHHKDKHRPTADELAGWKATLQSQYARLDEFLERFDIQVNNRTRSYVLALAVASSLDTARKRMSSACRYYNHVQEIEPFVGSRRGRRRGAAAPSTGRAVRRRQSRSVP